MFEITTWPSIIAPEKRKRAPKGIKISSSNHGSSQAFAGGLLLQLVLNSIFTKDRTFRFPQALVSQHLKLATECLTGIFREKKTPPEITNMEPESTTLRVSCCFYCFWLDYVSLVNWHPLKTQDFHSPTMASVVGLNPPNWLVSPTAKPSNPRSKFHTSKLRKMTKVSEELRLGEAVEVSCPWFDTRVDGVWGGLRLEHDMLFGKNMKMVVFM